MQISISRRSAAASVAAAAALVAASIAPSVAQDASSSRPAPTASAPAGAKPGNPAKPGKRRAPATVTLITGDKVTVTPGPDGAAPSIDVQRAPGATGSLRVTTEGQDTYVYPDEAVPYIADGRLDKQLFDVTDLVAQGYDDAHASDLPLIVTHKKSAATLKPDVVNGLPTPRPNAALPGSETTLSLPVVHGEAVRTRRSKSAAFWSALTGDRPAARNDDTSRAAPALPFTAGVDKVWLDGKVKATLADSTAQIGAPAAWAGGGTGAGVRVAVLDTGVDTTHPDLKDRIVDSRSFVPGEDILDRAGHGTHTASTVAGTGAASGGKEKGVAPGADLVVGKVLSNQNIGLDSWVLNGMEWAARTEHAKVISMSLGFAARTGQNNPLSQAVNQLTAETGALFVIAAGNNGKQGSYTVSAPGTADAALTVGAVDGNGRLASFSSLGPRSDDDGLKPDITAPGVDVLAARSQYINDGEGYYRTDSGTSMAAPHVAGAAVLLAQKHPDWTAQQLKDALMSTSNLTPDYTPYQAGTGSLNAASAYYAKVFATGSVDAGLVTWSPQTQRQPIERQITYTNTTDAPVTLHLSVDPGSSPAQAFTLGTDQVTVPAHGTAQADLVADPRGLAAGLYSAQVTASFDGGRMHTAAGFSVEPEKYALTVHLKDRAGRPMAGYADVRSSDGSDMFMDVSSDGTATRRLAPGSYMVYTYADVEGVHGPHSLGYAVLTAPEVELTGDRTVELDASQARQVKVATPKPTSIAGSRIDLYRNWNSPNPTGDGSALFDVEFPSAQYDSLWALPTKDKVKQGSFVFSTRIRAEQAPLTVTYGGHRLDDTLAQPGAKPLPDGTSHLGTVFAGTGSAAEYAGVSARGKAVVVRSSDTVAPTDQAAAAKAAGAAMLLVVNEDSGRKNDWYGDPDAVTTGPLPVASVTQDEGEDLINRLTSADDEGVELAVEAHPAPQYLYDLADYHVGEVPQDPSANTDPRSLARIDLDFTPPAGIRTTERRVDFPPYEWPGTPAPALSDEPVAPGPRTDWVSTGDSLKWQQFGTLVGYSELHTDPVAYQPGSVQKDRWFGPIMRPRLLSGDRLYRDQVSLRGSFHGFSDSGYAHSGPVPHSTQTVSLYQGDQLLKQIDNWPDFGAFGLAAQKLPYRLVYETSGDPTLSPYSPSTRTEWRFNSEAATETQVVPLVQLDYLTDLDADGRAGRNTGLSITPSVLGSSAAEDAVSSLGLEVSYDDGKTWTHQDLKEKSGSWQAKLSAPSQADYVSIRVTADQHNGGGATQTVMRAFGLK
ncbi:S8 family serine peptidase [Streptomyces sp. NPDC056227]|uniref:S8 family serine peptidase n=1 Tax=Streptomyces sp. NPDC056227 TaxID=3345753 RepID=UPI0035D7A6A7